MSPAPASPDGRPRCSWPLGDPLYLAYHDTEWGVPEWDDRALFEKLLLDGFQAGLAWIIILRKREHFRRAFDGFEPARIARWRAARVARLLRDPGIVRNRAKIEAAVRNARAFLALRERQPSFAQFLWQFVGGAQHINRWRRLREIPSQSEASRAMSKALLAAGFRFVGPTICYAFMQAVGMVNDHLVTCFRYRECMMLRSRNIGSGS
ncbi:MAG TPA: DNA-3-methyladenine glycosylase I [Polyangia bacterium]|nr:DNA-3-methyladenine glycosylase I [Polyangia bacterium]